MPEIHVILDGDGAWPDITERLEHGTLQWLNDDRTKLSVAALAGGMQSGLPSIAIRVDPPVGETYVVETSLRMFLQVAEMLKNRFGDPRQEQGHEPMRSVVDMPAGRFPLTVRVRDSKSREVLWDASFGAGDTIDTRDIDHLFKGKKVIVETETADGEKAESEYEVP